MKKKEFKSLAEAYCVITFYREEFTKSENEKRNELLSSKLRSDHYRHYPILGKWNEKTEVSFFVISHKKDPIFVRDMIKLKNFDKEYPQESIIIKTKDSQWLKILSGQNNKVSLFKKNSNAILSFFYEKIKNFS